MLTIFSAKLKENLKREREEGIEESMLKKAQESVIDAIEAKFDEVPEDIAKEIKDIDVLKSLLKKAIKSETLGEFRSALKTIKKE